MSTWHYITYICLSTDLFMHLCQRTKSFIKIPTLILYLKLWTSIFRRFGILKWRLLAGWVWNLASFWHKLWEGLYVSDRYTGILTLAKLKSFRPEYKKTWVLRHCKFVLLLITQGDINNIEQKVLSARLN